MGCLLHVDVNSLDCQAVMLEPTREKAQQCGALVQALGARMGVRCLHLRGSEHAGNWHRLSGQLQLLVGTPVCVHDLVCSAAIGLGGVNVLGLDGADEMLARGQRHLILAIQKALPEDTQVLLFAAAAPPDLVELASEVLWDPARVGEA